MRVLDPVIAMPAENQEKPSLRLSLAGRLEELAAVWPWLEALAAAYSIPAKMLFSMNLCLEEALSNIVRHGYGGGSSLPISVEFVPRQGDGFVFVIEDCAPPFDPLQFTPGEPAPAMLSDLEPGGHGIRLLRRFAGSLAYERLSSGNRLIIGFGDIARQ
jgi:serine/threonine-protein kinase RsbW